MEQTAATISSHLIGKKVDRFTFYNIGDHFFVFDPEAIWAFDGGVQIDFTDDQLFSFGMNLEFEAFDYSLEKSMHSFVSEGRVTGYQVDREVTESLKNLSGATITDLSFVWDYYQEYDEEAQLKEEKIYIPVELKLAFDNGDTLQIAAALYGIGEETGHPVNLRYDFYGQLVVAYNKELPIAIPEHAN